MVNNKLATPNAKCRTTKGVEPQPNVAPQHGGNNVDVDLTAGCNNIELSEGGFVSPGEQESCAEADTPVKAQIGSCGEGVMLDPLSKKRAHRTREKRFLSCVEKGYQKPKTTNTKTAKSNKKTNKNQEH